MGKQAGTCGARTVRLDEAARNRLDRLAETSDRTISQLVRYALASYFASPVPPAPPAGLPGERERSATRHATLRLTTDLTERVEAFAAACDATFSDVIRHAVDLWLDSAGPTVLGSPATGATR